MGLPRSIAATWDDDGIPTTPQAYFRRQTKHWVSYSESVAIGYPIRADFVFRYSPRQLDVDVSDDREHEPVTGTQQGLVGLPVLFEHRRKASDRTFAGVRDFIALGDTGKDAYNPLHDVPAYTISRRFREYPQGGHQCTRNPYAFQRRPCRWHSEHVSDDMNVSNALDFLDGLPVLLEHRGQGLAMSQTGVGYGRPRHNRDGCRYRFTALTPIPSGRARTPVTRDELLHVPVIKGPRTR